MLACGNLTFEQSDINFIINYLNKKKKQVL